MKKVFIRVFTPYHPYHHYADFYYDEDEYKRRLPIGTVVTTSMKLGVIMEEDIPKEELDEEMIKPISGLGDPKQQKLINKDWWNVVLEIHDNLNAQS